jgi:hypothetical protein
LRKSGSVNSDVSWQENMHGVEIHDRHPRGYLAFDLKEIIECLREEVLAREWRVEGVESTGTRSDELESLEGSNCTISGLHLYALTEGINQIIWGTFSGKLPTEAADSLIIKAIDSTLWEVFACSASLAKVQASFRDVRPAQYTAS